MDTAPANKEKVSTTAVLTGTQEAMQGSELAASPAGDFVPTNISSEIAPYIKPIPSMPTVPPGSEVQPAKAAVSPIVPSAPAVRDTVLVAKGSVGLSNTWSANLTLARNEKRRRQEARKTA